MSLSLDFHHLSGSLTGQRQRLQLDNGDQIILGRGVDCDIKFHDVEDDQVSSHHAVLTMEGARLYVEDQRSSNGTYVNGESCPPFQRVAVPDGARLRLAKSGPELQVEIDTDKVQVAAEGYGESSESRVQVGKSTLLREIDYARKDAEEQARSEIRASWQRSLLVFGFFALVLLVAIGGAAAAGYWWLQRAIDSIERVDDESIPESAVWPRVEQAVAPAVGWISTRYHFDQRQRVSDSWLRVPHEEVEVRGTGVLIAPGLVLSTLSVVEPWREAASWQSLGLRDWERISQETGLRPVTSGIRVRLPGLRPLIGNVTALDEDADLALISIPDVRIVPVPLATKSPTVAEEVGHFGYRWGMGAMELSSLAPDSSSAAELDVKRVDEYPGFRRASLSRIEDIGQVQWLDIELPVGSGGSPMVNRAGELSGIVSPTYQEGEAIEVLGLPCATRRWVGGQARVITRDQIERFLRQLGVR